MAKLLKKTKSVFFNMCLKPHFKISIFLSTKCSGSTKWFKKVPMVTLILQINVKIILTYPYRPHNALSLSKIFAKFFVKPVYPTMAWEHLQICRVQVTGKCIRESKNEARRFHSCAPGKTPQVLFITP